MLSRGARALAARRTGRSRAAVALAAVLALLLGGVGGCTCAHAGDVAHAATGSVVAGCHGAEHLRAPQSAGHASAPARGDGAPRSVGPAEAPWRPHHAGEAGGGTGCPCRLGSCPALGPDEPPAFPTPGAAPHAPSHVLSAAPHPSPPSASAAAAARIASLPPGSAPPALHLRHRSLRL